MKATRVFTLIKLCFFAFVFIPLGYDAWMKLTHLDALLVVLLYACFLCDIIMEAKW
jgi:hypothetical protein